MRSLTVIYDPRCEPSCAFVRWVARQPTYIPVELVAADEGPGSARPLLCPSPYRDGSQGDGVSAADELVAVDDAGGVYTADAARLAILWTLRGYRRWSYRFAAPQRRRHLDRFVSWVSRHRLSRLWLQLGATPWRRSCRAGS